MFRKNFNPLTTLICIVLVLIVAVITATPVTHPIKSIDETREMIAELGYQWQDEGVPVIVFASSHCPASKALEAELKRHEVYYLRVDVDTNEVGRSLHGKIGRNYFGTVATRATPTTVIGTTVIRGNQVEAILKEISVQNQKYN